MLILILAKSYVELTVRLSYAFMFYFIGTCMPQLEDKLYINYV